jgi:hypothetical protein
MTAPPHRIEALLEALGAEHGYRDAVIGDLTEEFQVRAERDGERVARRWYYAEALRSAPALARSWARGVRGREIAQLAGLALTAFVLSRVLVGFVIGMAYLVVLRTGVATAVGAMTGALFTIFALKAALVFADTVVAGFIAAWLHERAPLTSALALGALWSLLNIGILSALLSLGLFPAGYRHTLVQVGIALTGVTITILGTTLGGVLQVVRARSHAARARLSGTTS